MIKNWFSLCTMAVKPSRPNHLGVCHMVQYIEQSWACHNVITLLQATVRQCDNVFSFILCAKMRAPLSFLIPDCGNRYRVFPALSLSQIKPTLSAQSGTTEPNVFGFFATLWGHATLLIIVRLCWNLRCWIVHYLSFLEKKTELIYLHYRPFYNCSNILFHFGPNRCAHC